MFKIFMNHLCMFWLGHETMVRAICLTILLYLIWVTQSLIWVYSRMVQGPMSSPGPVLALCAHGNNTLHNYLSSESIDKTNHLKLLSTLISSHVYHRNWQCQQFCVAIMFLKAVGEYNLKRTNTQKSKNTQTCKEAISLNRQEKEELHHYICWALELILPNVAFTRTA